MILPNGAEWIDELGMNNSELAMEWVNENLLSQVGEMTYETVERGGDLVPLTRIKTQSYSYDGYTLVLTRTYPSVMSCAGVKAQYSLTN